MNRLRCISSESGAVLVFVAIALVVLLAMAALAIDLGIIYMAAQQLQNAVDAAALAGVSELRSGGADNMMDNIEAAKAEAEAVARSNSVLNDPVIIEAGDVQLGAWDRIGRQIVPWNETSRNVAVQVTAGATVDTLFARVIDIHSVDISRSAVGGIAITQRRNPVHMMIVQDASGSFAPAWTQATGANRLLLELFNEKSIPGDAAGIVAFNARFHPDWLYARYNVEPFGRITFPGYLYEDYVINYPHMNWGIKHTTRSGGRAFLTNDEGEMDPNGEVRPMAGQLTALDPDNSSSLPVYLDKACKLITRNGPYGDTDTAVGFDFARTSLNNTPVGTDRVIVLVSDGKPHDYSPSPYWEDREPKAEIAADAAAAEGIKIHTVTLAGIKDANFDFNEGLVRNGGLGLRATTAEDIKSLLAFIANVELGAPYLIR